jgi:hypothetical protein
MELEQQFVIPTASRVKISQKLSYPAGAESITIALASVPQLTEIRLHFYSWSDRGVRHGHYEFLRVEYLNDARPLEKWPIQSLYKRPTQGRWEIVVQPVPRTVRHGVLVARPRRRHRQHFLLGQGESRSCIQGVLHDWGSLASRRSRNVLHSSNHRAM